MGEIKNPENSGVSDPSGDEQTGDGEDKKIPVTENEEEQSPEGNESEDDQDVSDDTEAGSGEELIEEAKPVEEKTGAQSSEIDSLEPESTAKSTIVMQERTGAGDTLAQGALSTAEIQFTDGCASEDGTEVRKDTPITFLVLPKAGYKLKSLGYAADADAGTFTEETQLTPITLAGEGPYTVTQDKLAGDKNLLIVVETEEIVFTLNKSGDGTLNKVTTADGKTTLAAATDAETKFVNSKAGSIEINVSGLNKDKKYSAKAWVGSGDPLDLGEGTKKEADPASGTEKVPYWTYTFDATKLDKVTVENTDITVNVAITEVQATTVNGATATVDPATGSYTVTGVTIADDNAEQKKYVTYAATGTGVYKAGDQVAFTLTPDAAGKYELDGDIEVKLTKADKDDIDLGKVTDITKTFYPTEAENTAKANVYCTTIPTDLSESGYALQIKVKTKLQAAKSTKITFTSDKADFLTILGGTDAPLTDDDNVKAGTEYRVEGSAYKTAISSREGYQITKAEVTVKGTNGNTASDTFTHTYILNGEKQEDGSISNYPRYMIDEQTIDLSGTGTPGSNPADTKTWKATEVTINIEVSAEVEGADEQKVVTFVNKSGVDPATDGIPYVLTVAEPDEENNKVSYDKDTKEATIEENTPYLSFQVAAETEPVVVVDLDGDDTNDEDDTKLLEVTKGSGSYEYQIPAKAFIGEKGSVIITRKTAQVTAEIPALNARVDYAYKEGDVTKSGSLTNGSTATIDTDAEVKFTVRGSAGGTAPIKAVTWQYGEDGAAQIVAESAEGYVFTAKSSNEKEIIVKVDYETNERIYVMNGDDDYEGAWKAYEPGSTVEVDYENKITAYVSAGENNKIALINALVYDGKKLAQTKATVDKDNNQAVITSIAGNEQGQPLTITLVKADRTKVSFDIKPDRKASQIGYEELGENRNVTLGADMYMELSVDTNDAKAGKLAAAVIADEEELPKTVGENLAVSNDNIIANYDGDDKTLTITAKSIKSDVEKAGVVVLYNKIDKTIVGGSAIRVKVEAPFMQKEDVKTYSPTGTVIGRNYVIAMDKDALQAVAEKQAQLVDQDNAYYTVKVTPGTWTKPADMEDAAWTAAKARIEEYLAYYEYTSPDGKIVSISQLLNDGGHTIRLIPEDVEPLELSFTVVVTPVQVLADDSAVTGTKWESDEVKTAKVNYSETLKLGKGESKLTTGRDEDIVVATPEFAEGGNNRYNWVVQPVFINNKTKKTLGRTYEGLEAKWNPAAGTVTVNAAEATAYGNKYYGYYKDLAIKITVFTETGDYGVSGTKKLTVQNGIEHISLTVQPDIVYNNSNKKVTVSTTVGYNDDIESQIQYRKPQKKAVTYELFNVGKALTGGKVTVDAKGRIVLDKGITLSSKEEDNKFKIRAVAADGTGTKSNEVEVTVIGEAEKLNGLTLFDVSDEYKAKPLEVKTGSTFEVVNAYGQYRVVVLREGAKTNADGITYNLDALEDNGYVYDSSRISFTSSNKGIKVGPDGSITINKVGKTNITATLKSDKKEKKILKNVAFVVEDKPIVAELTQYANSDFTNAYTAVDFDKSGEYPAEGNTTGYYELTFKKLVKDEDGKDKYESFTLPNYSVSFSKNAKKAVYQPYTDRIRFTATGTNAVVTVSNKERAYKNSNKIVITIKNAADADLQNAPKVSVITNSTNPVLAGKGNDITVKVTPAKKTDKIWDAEKSTYVMLSIDQTKKTKVSANAIFYGELDLAKTLRRESDTEGRFDLWMNSYCQAENYTLIVTMGTMENGIFTQTHKEARLNIKPKNANTKIKATAKYTLNPYGASSQAFNVSGGDFDNAGDVYFLNTPKDGNFAQNVIMKGGEPNEFNRFFEITAADNHYDDDEGYANGVKGSTIAIRQDLKPDELKLLADKDYMKNNLTGYVTVTNGYQELDVKITVALKAQKDLKLKAEATPTITGKVVTDIQVMNGKEPVSIEAYSISGNSLDFKSYYETVKDTGDQTQKDTEKQAELNRLAKGIIRVSADDAKKGKQSFDLQIVTSDTAYGYKYAEKEVANKKVYDTDNCLLTNALKVSGKIEVKETKKATNKVVFAKGATAWKVGRSDWETWEKEDGSTGYGWEKGLDYSIKNKLSGAAKINVTTDKAWVSMGSDDYTNGAQWLDIKIDKTALESALTKKINWNKSVKVKATFSYLDKDDKELSIPKDTVTFTITLPEQPGFESAADLNIEITKNKAKLQNLADRRFMEAQYDIDSNPELMYDEDDHYIDEDAQKKKFAEEWVKWELVGELKNIAKGTTAALEVDAKYADNKCDYTIKVEGQKVIDFTSRFEANLDSVETALQTIKTNLTGDKKADQAKALGLKYSPMTEAGELRTKLIGILREQNLLTNNMSVSVVREDKDRYGNDVTKAPTTAGDGSYKATVTVKDSSIRQGSGNTRPVTLDYTFNRLSALTAYQAGGDKAITNATNGLTDAKLAELINKAYFKNNGGIDADRVMNNDMENALIAEIEAFANTLVADNEYLSVSGINKRSFTVEYVDSSDNTVSPDRWKVSFIISYTNADPDAKRAEDKEFDVSVEDVTAQFTTFNGGQTAAQLKNVAETAMGDRILPATCNTKDAAIAAIKKIITDKITNPAYKADAQLKIELNGVESEAFKAPEKEGDTTTAGWINVKVTYDADEEEPEVTGEYTFTIGSTVTSGGETIEEKVARVETRVKALLTPSVIEKAVTDEYKKAANNYDADTVKTAVETALETAVSDALITGTVDLADATPITVESLVLPKGTKDADKGSYGAIKVSLKYNDGKTNQTKPVTIAGGDLAPGVLYQSEDEFRDALKTAVEAAIVPYNAGYLANAGDNNDGTVEDGVVDDKKTDIANAIGNTVKELAALDTIATNPKWRATSYVNAITAEPTTTGEAADQTKYSVNAEKQITVTKVVLTIGTVTEGDGNKRTVTVTIGGPADQSLVRKVEIKKIDDVTVSGDAGSTVEKAIEITAPETDIPWDLTAEVTGTPGLQETDKDVNWSLKKVDTSTEWNSTNVTDTEFGNTGDKIKISDDKKKLVVAKDAFTPTEEVTVYLVATAEGTKDPETEGADNKAGVFVKIKLPEKYTLAIKDSNETSEARTTLEAPADETPVTYTYKAVLEGSHVKDTTVVEFETPTVTPTDDKATLAVNEDDKSQLLAKVEKGAKDHEITLKAKVKDKTPEEAVTLPIKVVANETLAANALIKLQADGMTDAEWKDEVLTIKNKTAKDVKIPFIIEDTSRDWTKLAEGKFAVTVKTNKQNADTFVDKIKVVKGTGKENGMLFLQVANTVPEVNKAAPVTDDAPAVEAPEFTLTATFDATATQAKVVTTLDFKLVVEKTYTDIVIAHNPADGQEEYVNDYTITKQTGDTTVTLGATVKGAHVDTGDDADDQKVIWKVESRGAGSKATINSNTGVLTIPEKSVDNRIRISATSKVNSKIVGYFNFKVITE